MESIEMARARSWTVGVVPALVVAVACGGSSGGDSGGGDTGGTATGGTAGVAADGTGGTTGGSAGAAGSVAAGGTGGIATGGRGGAGGAVDGGTGATLDAGSSALCGDQTCAVGERCCDSGCSVCVPEAVSCSVVVCSGDEGVYDPYPSGCFHSPSCDEQFCGFGRPPQCYRCRQAVLASPCVTFAIDNDLVDSIFCCP